MDGLIIRIAHDLLGRITGPIDFRFIIQPVMAVLLALRDGRHDANMGRIPYVEALFRKPDSRMKIIADGWRSIARLFAMAIVVDVAYQLIVLHAVYPGEALIVAVVFALLPYLLLRGPANAFWKRRNHV